jgi:hypothetical protein
MGKTSREIIVKYLNKSMEGKKRKKKRSSGRKMKARPPFTFTLNNFNSDRSWGHSRYRSFFHFLFS